MILLMQKPRDIWRKNLKVRLKKRRILDQASWPLGHALEKNFKLPSFWSISSPIPASPIISKPAGNANATSPPHRPRLKPRPSSEPILAFRSGGDSTSKRRISKAASVARGFSLTRRWWMRGGRCSARRSRRSWPARPSASSGAATRSSASRRRAGGRRAPTRSSSASASAPPSGCSRRWGPSPRTPSRRPASLSAVSRSSTPVPTPARAPSASTSTRCPTGTTYASRGARASASSSPQPSCSGHALPPLVVNLLSHSKIAVMCFLLQSVPWFRNFKSITVIYIFQGME